MGRARRAEAQRRRMTTLLRNHHGIAEWELFLNKVKS
jgi:hypothetical protein